MILYKGKVYKWNYKKLLKNIFYGVETFLIFLFYYYIFFNMLVKLIQRYS